MTTTFNVKAAEHNIMQEIDATPSADFPAQVIILDRHIAQRHPKKAFYLRVKIDERQVKTIDLYGAVTTNEARQMARDQGFEPTHWVQIHEDNSGAIGPYRLP